MEGVEFVRKKVLLLAGLKYFLELLDSPLASAGGASEQIHKSSRVNAENKIK